MASTQTHQPRLLLTLFRVLLWYTIPSTIRHPGTPVSTPTPKTEIGFSITSHNKHKTFLVTLLLPPLPILTFASPKSLQVHSLLVPPCPLDHLSNLPPSTHGEHSRGSFPGVVDRVEGKTRRNVTPKQPAPSPHSRVSLFFTFSRCPDSWSALLGYVTFLCRMSGIRVVRGPVGR